MRKMVINDNSRFHSMWNRKHRLNPEEILMKKEWVSGSSEKLDSGSLKNEKGPSFLVLRGKTD
jgi:hypothetical protein